MNELKQLINEGWINVRAVIELAGKPKEHIEQTMKDYVGKISENPKIKLIESTIADTVKVEDDETSAKNNLTGMWSTYAELDFAAKDMLTLSEFCINYMPSSIEIAEPSKAEFDAKNLTVFFNDLQARLHKLDMIAKQSVTKQRHTDRNLNNLLKNFITLLLRQKAMSAHQLSMLTAVEEQAIEKFLENLLDQGYLKLEGDLYHLKKNETKSS